MDAIRFIRWWSEPPVHDLGFAARAAAHTGIWAAWLLLMQYACLLLVALCRKTHLRKYPAAVQPPKLSRLRMLAETSLGFMGWTWGIGLVAAWINPGAADGWQWSYECPNLLLLGYYSTAVLMLYDAYSFPLHKWMHECKAAFNLLHRKHHSQQAALDATTSGYMALTDGVVSGALPIAISYALGLATGNWWYTLAGMWNSQLTSILGHCAAEVTTNDWRDFLVTMLNPFALWYYLIPCHATPMKHADHHMYPRRNYAFYFTYWDDRFGTSHPPRPPCSLLVLAAHAVYQAALLGGVYLLLTRPATTLAAWVTCYLLVPAPAASAAAEVLRLPGITRRLFGRVIDAYRADNFITYAAAGAAGSLQLPGPGPESAPAPAASANTCCQDAAAEADGPAGPCQQAQQQQEPLLIFAVHPTGIVSRSAFCTFAARGWSGPLSSLRQVRLAVGSQLFAMPIPFLREFLLACGCIPADRGSMLRALRAGRSVAVTPGGWREGQLYGSYKLLLKQRSGFVTLSQQSGALLVPVLCLGEQDLAAAPAPGPLLWGYRFLQTFRPHPVRVVFGKAVCPQVGESTAQLHKRYVQALLALGDEHGVQLELV